MIVMENIKSTSLTHLLCFVCKTKAAQSHIFSSVSFRGTEYPDYLKTKVKVKCTQQMQVVG